MLAMRLNPLPSLWARFKADRKGNVATMFALALVPLVGAVGTAVDYSRANAARTAMQAAIDTTALIISKDATTMSAADLNTRAQSLFSSLYNHPEVNNVAVNATYSLNNGGSNVVVNASGAIDTNFVRALGTDTIQFSTSTTATWGSSRLRVALVLDNTGSMSSAGKIGALKTASHNLLTQLQTAAKNNGDVYVSIVPFAKDVNIGTANVNATWVDWTAWNAANGSYNPCTARNRSGTCTAGTWVPNNHSTWNGCITDRDQNYDVNVTVPNSVNVSTQFPAEQYDSCPTAVMPLSYDWAGLNAKIDLMQPSGGTNQPIGLVWGWQSLVQTSPLNAPAKDPNYRYQDIIILLSDGLNTQDRWYGNGSSVSTQVDARMNLVCANAKAAGMTIYAVQVNTDGDPTSTVMKNCASSTDNFFMLTTANQIVTTFNTIGTNLSKLRLAR